MDRKTLVGFRQRLRGTALYQMSATQDPLCMGCQAKETNSLLYVGIARNPLGRLATHSTAEWAPDVTQVRIHWYPTRTAAFDAAALTVRRETPYYNMQRRHPPPPGGRFVGAAAAVYRLSCHPVPLCEDCRSQIAKGAIHAGVAESPLADIHQHRQKKWAARVTHIGIEYYPSLREALKVEAIARKRVRVVRSN